jgi:hypothetical protein
MQQYTNGNSLLEVFLNDKLKEYNCNAYRIYFEAVLLRLYNKKCTMLQAICFVK